MSKNLELLTQLGEKYRELQSPPRAAKTTAATAESLPESPPPAALVPLPWTSEEATSGEVAKLVQRVFIAPGEEAPKRVVFCGADEENGSNLICARVAEALASRTSGRICLVDANVLAPLSSHPEGMAGPFDAPDGLLDPEIAVTWARQIQGRKLWLLPAYAEIGGRRTLIAPDHWRKVLAELETEFHTILIAAGPVHRCPDTMMICQTASGVILVIKANATRRATARKVKEDLEVLQVPLLGAVLNDRTYPIPERLYRRL